jgi:methanogenic corrinoid protein MtbC1
MAGIEWSELLKDATPVHEAVLAQIITQTVLPALFLQNSELITSDDGAIHPAEVNIHRLGGLILGPDNADAMDYINSLRDRGVSLDNIHLELIEPTARHLGELWDRDQIDFIAVTLGVSRLQRIVHHFADLDNVEAYDEKRRALIMVAPGDDHSFGNQMVQKFMRAAGWTVLTLTGFETEKATDIVSRNWVAVVGVSINGYVEIESLRRVIASIRAQSLNPHIGVMIGGPMLVARPELVEELGADGTAVNAASAVVLAKKILAQGLIAQNTAISRHA